VEDQRFWDALGRKLLAPLLIAAAGTDRHIADVVRLVDYRAEDEVQDLLDTLGDPDAIAAWAANPARPDKTKGSVYGTAEVVLESSVTPPSGTRWPPRPVTRPRSTTPRCPTAAPCTWSRPPPTRP